jgi:hypothetical protein
MLKSAIRPFSYGLRKWLFGIRKHFVSFTRSRPCINVNCLQFPSDFPSCDYLVPSSRYWSTDFGCVRSVCCCRERQASDGVISLYEIKYFQLGYYVWKNIEFTVVYWQWSLNCKLPFIIFLFCLYHLNGGVRYMNWVLRVFARTSCLCLCFRFTLEDT